MIRQSKLIKIHQLYLTNNIQDINVTPPIIKKYIVNLNEFFTQKDEAKGL